MNIFAKSKLYSYLFRGDNWLFHQLIEENRAGIFIADDDGNLLYINSAFVNILGYLNKNELLGKNLDRELFYYPEDSIKLHKLIDKIGFASDHEVQFRRKDGVAVVLSVTSNWIKDESNSVIGIEGIAHDITEKKRVEKSFIEEKEKLTQVLSFEESLNLIHQVDQLGKFAVEQISAILKTQKCSLMLYDQEKHDLYIQAGKGLEASTISYTRKKMGEPIAGIVAQKREPILVNNIEYDKDFHRSNRPYYATRSFMCAPIMCGPKFLGVINVSDKLTTFWELFTQNDLKMLCIMAHAVGIALENARMFKHLEELAEGEPWASFRHKF